MVDPNLILGHLIRGRELILRHWRPDSCIASTAIALKVLAHFEIPARPVVVRAGVYNAILWEHIVASEGEGPDPDEVEALRERGGKSVLLGWNPNPERDGGVGSIDEQRMGWSGHLVAVVEPQGRGRRGLLDLSIDQAARPEKQIITKPFLGDKVDDAFLEGRDQLIYTFPDWKGTVVVYQAFPDVTSYEVSPDWSEGSRHERIVQTLIRRINADGHSSSGTPRGKKGRR